MPEPVFLVVVSSRCGTAVSRHDLQTLVQGSNGHFKVQALTVRYFHWEIIPGVLALVVLVMIKIHTDRKTAIPERKTDKVYRKLKSSLIIML